VDVRERGIRPAAAELSTLGITPVDGIPAV
jgi:hypothetical protein